MSRLFIIIAIWLRPVLSHPYLTLATRIGLGGTFIFAGIAKLPHLSTFQWEVGQYDILPSVLEKPYAYVLPGFEVFLGAFLLLGLFLRISASVSILFIVSFIIAKIVAYARGLDITVCSCFGPAVPLLAPYSLALDFVLLALAFQILLHRRDFLALGALGPWLSRKVTEAEEE